MAAVGTAVDDLAATDVKRRAASVASRGQQKAAARLALIGLLHQGNQLAKVLRADGHTLPPCDLPPSTSDQNLLTAGRHLAETATTFAADFGDHEMPSARIMAVTTAFETAVHDREMARASYVAARTSISGLLKTAVRQVHRLDLIVGALLAADDVALAEWQLTRRVDDVRRQKPAVPAPAEAASAAEPVPTENAKPTAA
jgi:hypothetical protein